MHGGSQPRACPLRPPQPHPLKITVGVRFSTRVPTNTAHLPICTQRSNSGVWSRRLVRLYVSRQLTAQLRSWARPTCRPPLALGPSVTDQTLMTASVKSNVLVIFPMPLLKHKTTVFFCEQLDVPDSRVKLFSIQSVSHCRTRSYFPACVASPSTTETGRKMKTQSGANPSRLTPSLLLRTPFDDF